MTTKELAARFRARAGGFTLLEVMVAVAVLGIAMTALHYGQAQSIRAQARTQNVTLATLLAMEKMDDLLTRDRAELPRPGDSQEGTFEPPYDFFHWTVRAEENAMVPELIKDIHLTISWDVGPEGKSGRPGSDGGGGNSLEVCLYVTLF